MVALRCIVGVTHIVFLGAKSAESQIDIINAVWYNISPGQRTVLLNYLSTLQFRQTHMVDEGIEYQFTDLMSALENDLHRNNALTTEDYTNVSRLLVLIPTLSHAAIAQISRDLNQRHRVAFVVHQTSIQADGNELHEISSTAASVGGSIQTFGTGLTEESSGSEMSNLNSS